MNDAVGGFNFNLFAQMNKLGGGDGGGAGAAIETKEELLKQAAEHAISKLASSFLGINPNLGQAAVMPDIQKGGLRIDGNIPGIFSVLETRGGVLATFLSRFKREPLDMGDPSAHTAGAGFDGHDMMAFAYAGSGGGDGGDYGGGGGGGGGGYVESFAMSDHGVPGVYEPPIFVPEARLGELVAQNTPAVTRSIDMGMDV